MPTSILKNKAQTFGISKNTANNGKKNDLKYKYTHIFVIGTPHFLHTQIANIVADIFIKNFQSVLEEFDFANLYKYNKRPTGFVSTGDKIEDRQIITNAAVKGKMEKMFSYKCNSIYKNIIFAGFPYTIEQVRYYIETLKLSDMYKIMTFKPMVINFKANYMQENQPDPLDSSDNPEFTPQLQEEMAFYEKYTIPAIKLLKEKGVPIYEIDAKSKLINPFLKSLENSKEIFSFMNAHRLDVAFNKEIQK